METSFTNATEPSPSSGQVATEGTTNEYSCSDPTPSERQNIVYKLVTWKLQRDYPYTPDINKYPTQDKDYPHLSFLFKILCVTDPDYTYTPEKVAEAKEFIDYWKKMNCPML